MEIPKIIDVEPNADETTKRIMDFALAGSREIKENPKDPDSKTDVTPELNPQDDKVIVPKTSKEVEPEPTPIKRTSKFPEVTEDDYSENKDGTVVIKAQHIADDLKAIIEEDASIFLKIQKAKNGNKKIEVIAKALGFKSDGIRSAEMVAKDIIEAYVAADDEKKQEIADEFFPDQLRYSDAEKSYSEEISPEKKEPVQPKKDNSSDIINAVNAFLVDRRDLKREDLMENVEFLDKMNKPKFNQDTGELLSSEEKGKVVAEEVFGKSKDPAKEDLTIVGGGKNGKSDRTNTENKTDAQKITDSIVEKMKARINS